MRGVNLSQYMIEIYKVLMYTGHAFKKMESCVK